MDFSKGEVPKENENYFRANLLVYYREYGSCMITSKAKIKICIKFFPSPGPFGVAPFTIFF